jgi:DNA polymerase II small subunit
MNKKDLIEQCLDRGILVSDDMSAEELDSTVLSRFLDENPGLLVLDQSIVLRLAHESQQHAGPTEASGETLPKNASFCNPLPERGTVKVLFDYREPMVKKEVDDFVDYYNARYKAIEPFLRARTELSGLTSIGRILTKRDRENVSLIGLIHEKSKTQKGEIVLKVEDQTGMIKVHVSAKKPEVHEIAKNLVMDEVIGITGVAGDKIVFCTNIIIPDIPLHKELKKSPLEEYVLFLSDLHVGSKQFLDKKLDKFIRWLNGEIGNEEHRQILPKIKYLFIGGDLVDGVGIYPNQEQELLVKDIFEQYRQCAEYLARIPPHIQVIMCPGNHDSIRMSEPQPAFDRVFARPLFDLPHVTLLSNPCIVNIASREGFPGFDVLMYHGYSFDYFISNVDEIRNSGGYDRADLVMKFLLQRRHLAPTHTATLYVPDHNTDPLVISKVPDFFVSGHIHKSCVASYRNVSLISGSCWQSITSFQERVGHHPEPAHVPLVNLQTRTTKILRF